METEAMKAIAAFGEILEVCSANRAGMAAGEG